MFFSALTNFLICSMPFISQLFIYPVKSLGGVSVETARLTDRGLEHDRRWMLVDEQNRFLTQRQLPQMALLQTVITADGIVVFPKSNPENRALIPFNTTGLERCRVNVWDDWCEAVVMNDELNKWFCGQLSLSCRLVFMPDDSLRKVDARYAVHEKDITGFSDGYPLLLIGQASLDELNSRLEDPLPVDRFRPNIVLGDTNPYEEDEMESFETDSIRFYGVKLCARCSITTTNQDTGERKKEPLKTLATYRMLNNKIYFGQNVLYDQTGILHTGDQVRIVSRKAKPLFEKM